MARLPYPYTGTPRFVVDSEGVVTDKRHEFLQYAVSRVFAGTLMLWGTGGYKPSQDFWIPESRPSNEAADALEYATKPYRTFVTLDEVSTFDQKALDTLISDQLKAQRKAKERLIFEEQS